MIRSGTGGKDRIFFRFLLIIGRSRVNLILMCYNEIFFTTKKKIHFIVSPFNAKAD
jgi:hypothetical protein